MSLNPALQNTLSIVRYRLSFDRGELDVPHFTKAKFDFLDDTPVEVKSGFCSLFDPTKLDWGYAEHIMSPYRAIGFRIDRRTLPGATVKLEVHKAIQNEIAERNKERNRRLAEIKERGLTVNKGDIEPEAKHLSKRRKAEIKDQIKLRMLPTVPAKPKHIGIVYDEDRSTLFLVGASSADLKIIESKIHHILSGEENVYTFARMTPSEMGDSPDVSGLKFITDMWAGESPTQIDFSWEFGESATVVKSSTHETITASSNGQAHHEVISSAIRDGAHISKAALGFENPLAEMWKCTLNADMSVTGLDCPAIDIHDGEEAEEVLVMERMYLVQKFFTMLDTLFAIYIRKQGFSWTKALPIGFQDVLADPVSATALENAIVEQTEERAA
jgi:hypothetical protein